ncbi:hypothetical protein N7509_011109 [Penicillium cosmopolitanum]|uniref:Uncharacterized protein n=1 Tax=Penicillium cosmopolitanum TaxID=1131564 RepID=A0A9W9VSL6_9EURO|nr:uncharacterized protein N7509_011109 [Penicillium cosmopolitanum]KAJ5388568.1 hypothetical protein N7509_011109 [Penicillium cosmopolitanum]
MFLRMKRKYFFGLRQSKNGAPALTKDNPILDGCQHYDKRKAPKDKYSQGFLTDSEYNENDGTS